MTRDQISVPLRETEQLQQPTITPTYKGDASVLDQAIKPMLYDPYMQYEDQPMMEDYYYDDYYDAALPNFSALKGDSPSNHIQTKSLPAMVKVNSI